jgi:tyrosyl-tRNA synthetase
MPLLEGLDGVNKMSKSLENTIGITDSPGEMFGKLMSISDELMWRYFELLSFRSLEEIEGFKRQAADGRNPRDIKYLLAEEIVARFHDQEAADKARQDFIARHRHGATPEDMDERQLSSAEPTLAIAPLLRDVGLTSSSSEALRMVSQGAVRIDGERVDDPKKTVEVDGIPKVFQVGKRKFARVTLTPAKN